MYKKWFSILMVVVIMMGFFTVCPFTVNAQEVDIAKDGANVELAETGITQSEFNSRLNNLREQYPNYSTWYDSFDGGIQCFGFARLVAYNVFGSHVYDWSISKSMDGVKAGDVVQYGNTSGDGHTIFVLSVSGSTIKYVDCNGNGGYCKVRWDDSVTIGTKIFGLYSFNYRHVSPNIDPDPDPFANYSPVDYGSDFYAQIKNLETGKVLSKDSYISGAAFDVKATAQNGSAAQLWHFIKLNDNSYAIKNAENDWCLDVEAGNNLGNLRLQPNGTNVQLYNTYNGTENQRFYLYYLWDSFYIKPVGMDRMVDMSLSDGKIAVWDYGENFAPQRFTIVKSEFKGNRPANLGADFYAQIKNKEKGFVFSKNSKISNSAFDVKATAQNGDIGQLWHFTRLGDGSYVIRNCENNWCLDVEAGYHLNDINQQPNGTNIQLYSSYNGNDNQRFYIYSVYNSYYIKPVGCDKIVDMSLSTGDVAVWGAGEDFAPQKFNIVKSDLKGNMPTDLGTDFYAQIKNIAKDYVLTKDNKISDNAFNVKAVPQNGSKEQLWHFTRLGDGSYVIRNDENNWCLDVEAGYNLNNLDLQPNGTNIQIYSSYNGTDNQRFYIYKMFNSYYIRPVGTNLIVDMSLSNGEIAVWGYGDDFAPQKFDIVKINREEYYSTEPSEPPTAPPTEPPTNPPTTPPTEPPTAAVIKLGDVDGDGEVTIIDATCIQRKLASIATAKFVEAAADADEDDSVTILDATEIQRYIAKLPSNDSIGKPIA